MHLWCKKIFGAISDFRKACFNTALMGGKVDVLNTVIECIEAWA